MQSNNLANYTNFLYIFPAAVWVNSVAPTFADSQNFLTLATYILFFLFIPAELVSSALWQKASVLRKIDNDSKDTRQGILGFIDIFRILCLTIAYATITKSLGAGASLYSSSILTLSLGLFLILNYFWNKVEVPAKISVFSLMRDKLVARFKASVTERGKIGNKFTLEIYDALYRIHNVFIEFIFPALGFILFAASVLCLSSKNISINLTGEQLLYGLSVGCFIVFFLQVLFKFFQVLSLTSVINYVEAIIKSEPPPVPSAVRVFTVDVATMKVAQTQKFKLKDIAEFRFRCYSEDEARRYPGVLFLSKDDIWDQNSAHIVALENGQPVGVGRVSMSVGSRLPVSDEISFERSLGNEDCELSRFVIRHSKRRSRAVIALFYGAVTVLKQQGGVGDLFADIIVGGKDTFSKKRFEKMGFISIGISYTDYRYECRSEIMKLAEEDFGKFAGYIEKLARSRVRPETNTV